MTKKFREPISGFTHFAGAIISLIGLFALLIKAYNNNVTPLIISGIILFGISLILLYSASATYHLAVAKEKIIFYLRKIDHSMIYILIAGTYSPICLSILHGKFKWIYFISIWLLAFIGVILKLFMFNIVPSWVSTVSYVVMGWLSVILIPIILRSTSLIAIILLILGGVLYTVGAVIYQVDHKKSLQEGRDFIKKITGHDIFHIFVLLGSLSHYIMILIFII